MNKAIVYDELSVILTLIIPTITDIEMAKVAGYSIVVPRT